MLQVLVRSVAIDIFENAVVAGVLNAAWLMLGFILGIGSAALAATAPGAAILLITVTVVLLLGLLGPMGIYLETLARRETPQFSTLASALLCSLGASLLIALGGMALLSLLALSLPLTLELPSAWAVAGATLTGWAALCVVQWMLLAIGLSDRATLASLAPARNAAFLVLSRPAHAIIVLVGAVVSIATLVILLPGPCGAALLVRRAGYLAGDGAEFDRVAAASARRSGLSVLFPWKQ